MPGRFKDAVNYFYHEYRICWGKAQSLELIVIFGFKQEVDCLPGKFPIQMIERHQTTGHHPIDWICRRAPHDNGTWSGYGAVGYLIEFMHGAGPPTAQRIMIQRQANLDDKINRVKAFWGIK